MSEPPPLPLEVEKGAELLLSPRSNLEPLPLEVLVPEGPPVSQDPTWVPENFEDLLDLFRDQGA